MKVKTSHLSFKQKDNFIIKYINYIETSFRTSKNNRYKRWLLTLSTLMIMLSIVLLAALAANTVVFGAPLDFGALPFDVQSVTSNEINNVENAAIPGMQQRCTNTEQGKEYITDDRGFVCKRKDMDTTSRCCKNNDPVSDQAAIPVSALPQYSCNQCNTTTYCCTVYEFCVSCCMDPYKERLRYQVLQALKVSGDGKVYDALSKETKNTFEYCKAICRTSSKSVFAINRYRNDEKHCYGKYGPPIADPELMNLMTEEEKETLVKNAQEIENAKSLELEAGSKEMNDETNMELVHEHVDAVEGPNPGFRMGVYYPSSSSSPVNMANTLRILLLCIFVIKVWFTMDAIELKTQKND